MLISFCLTHQQLTCISGHVLRVYLRLQSSSNKCFKVLVKDLSPKVNTTIQPVFASWNIKQELNVKEANPPIINEQCVVYNFQCDLCDAGYVGYTCGCLHNREKGHKQQSSAIAKHYKNIVTVEFNRQKDTKETLLKIN